MACCAGPSTKRVTRMGAWILTGVEDCGGSVGKVWGGDRMIMPTAFNNPLQIALIPHIPAVCSEREVSDVQSVTALDCIHVPRPSAEDKLQVTITV